MQVECRVPATSKDCLLAIFQRATFDAGFNVLMVAYSRRSERRLSLDVHFEESLRLAPASVIYIAQPGLRRNREIFARSLTEIT